jgi:hypothetical protein
MSSTQFSTIPIAPAPARRRRRWRVVLLIVAFAILVPIVLWGYTFVSTRGAWGEAEAEAALDMPRWRLMELEADRPDIPDQENSALHINAIRRMAGAFCVGMAPNYEQIFEKLPPATQLNVQQSELIRGRLATIPGPLAEARKLKDMPRGRFPITYSDDFIGTLLPDHQRSRNVVEWLQHDAFLLAQDEKGDQAVESCQAIFNAGRAMDGELLVISHLIRVALQQVSVITLERVLAQGQASEERLRAMQALLEEDLRGDGWLSAIRGERAGMHHLFDNIRTGKVQTPSFRSMGLGGGGGVESITFWFIDTFPSTLLKYYPEYLRHMSRCVDISKLPIHERTAKMQEWEADCKNTKNPVIKLLGLASSKVSQAECRNQAMLRSAMVALACERYRLKQKDRDNAWPASLDVLVKEKLLAAIPADPMDGKPIRYRRTKEGIVVYSIGLDMTDNQGNIDPERVHEPGVDIGFRLWDVKLRRQNPLPPVAFRE